MSYPVNSASGGRSIETYVEELRDYLNDRPQYADEQFNGTGTATNFLCTQLPINDDQYVTATISGTPVPIVTSRAQINADNVYLDYNTGRVIFGTAPPNGQANVQVHKDKVERRDSTLARTLMMGLRATYPALWSEETDTSIQMQTNVWDYQLPEIFSAFTNIFIIKVELQNVPLGTPEPYLQMPNWERIGSNQIKVLLSQQYTVGATLRITYAKPRMDLTELEGKEANLPILYALGMLLGTKEIRRARFDTQTTASDVSANPPGASQNAGSYFMKQFYQELQQLSRPIPMPPQKSQYVR